MTASIKDLLAHYQRGSLPLEVFRARVRELCDADTSQLSRWIAEVREEMAAGRVAEPLGRGVLDMLTAANSATQLAADETLAQAPAGTLVRKAPSAEPDATPTLRAPNQTIRIIDSTAETAARTLLTPKQTLVRGAPASAEAPRDRTQVITERLVRSLDQIGTPHSGPLQPGSVIKNRFELEKLIGKGGMGLVFAALDRRKQEAHDPNPRVALKVLNADFQRHPQSLIALQREARKAQSLAHPNVVTVFDFDRDGDAVYMTMELLEGRALEAFVREARGVGMKPAQALTIIRGIAEGLAYAHRKGIVHSDLKPGNVFVLEDGTPKILDFGIARAVPNADDEAPDVFDAGTLGAYTEAYATDEMVGGSDPHPADDLYALGLIAYELITGFHPYERHSAPKARELGLKPPPLKGLRLREARALERCLSFDRKQRPQNASEFLKAFRGVTATQKISVAAAVVLAIAAGYFSYENYRQASPAVPFTQLPLQQQEQFRAAMAEGDRAWEFYRGGEIAALNDALAWYADAYATHERNRDAVKALNKVAEAWLAATKSDPQLRRRAAQQLLEHSNYYRRYEPVAEAAR